MKIDYSQTYLYKLHVLTNALDKVFDDTLQQQAGIGLSQFTLLLTVSDRGAINQAKIASFLNLSPAAISRRVEIAQSRGWLSVHDSSSNRRDQIVQITPAGNKVIVRGVKALDQQVFWIFDDDNRQAGLMQHIDTLLTNIKSAKKGHRSASVDTVPIGQNKVEVKKGATMNNNIPKARQLFRGDINDAVIRVQKATGIEITPGWWDKNVGNNGSTESILDRFDKAYAAYVADKQKK